MKAAIQILDILAWPCVALIGFTMFRHQIRSIFERIASFEGLGFKASLGEPVREVQEIVQDTQSAAADLNVGVSTEASGVVLGELTFAPVDVDDISDISIAFKKGHTVRVDVSGAKDSVAIRIVYMVAGMVLASRGTFERVAPNVLVAKANQDNPTNS